MRNNTQLLMVHYHFRTAEGPSLGPSGADEFQMHLQAGQITNTTMVWRSGMLEWTTYANLRNVEDGLIGHGPSTPPPVKKAVGKREVTKVTFSECGLCSQTWPDSLMFAHEDKLICANCERRKKEDPKFGKRKKAPVAKSPVARKARPVSRREAMLIKCGGVVFGLVAMVFLNMHLREKRVGTQKPAPQPIQQLAQALP